MKNSPSKQREERITHPTHYNQGIEMWDYASSHNLDFFEGNIVKYITRWRDKNGVEDLYKAKRYLDKFITIEEKKVMEKLQEGSKELFDEQMYFALTPHKEMEEGS